MLELNELSVQELNSQDFDRINGGYWVPALMLLGAMINDAQNNPEDFVRGMQAWGY